VYALVANTTVIPVPVSTAADAIIFFPCFYIIILKVCIVQ